MILLLLKKKDKKGYISYTNISFSDVPEKIYIDTNEFNTILKRIKKSDVLSLSIDSNDLIIDLEGEFDRKFKIKLIAMDYESPVPPTVEFPASISVPSNIVNQAITDMELFSEKTHFIINDEYFFTKSDGEFGDAHFKYLHGESINGSYDSCFSIPKLKDIFSASKFSDNVTVNLGNSMPLGLNFELITGDGELSYLLAPRLETEDDD